MVRGGFRGGVAEGEGEVVHLVERVGEKWWVEGRRLSGGVPALELWRGGGDRRGRKAFSLSSDYLRSTLGVHARTAGVEVEKRGGELRSDEREGEEARGQLDSASAVEARLTNRPRSLRRRDGRRREGSCEQLRQRRVNGNVSPEYTDSTRSC